MDAGGAGRGVVAGLTLVLAAVTSAVWFALTPPDPAGAVDPVNPLPPGGALDVASEQLGDQHGRDLIVARTADNRLFYTTGAKGSWSGTGWQPVPGGVKTLYRPELERPNRTNSPYIHMLVVDLNGYLRDVVFDSGTKTWLSWEQSVPSASGLRFTGAPAYVTDGSNAPVRHIIGYGYKGTETPTLYVQTFRPSVGWLPDWRAWGGTLPAGIPVTRSQPSAAHFDGAFKVFANRLDTDGRLKVAYADPETRTADWQWVPPAGCSGCAPSANLAEADEAPVVAQAHARTLILTVKGRLDGETTSRYVYRGLAAIVGAPTPISWSPWWGSLTGQFEPYPSNARTLTASPAYKVWSKCSLPPGPYAWVEPTDCGTHFYITGIDGVVGVNSKIADGVNGLQYLTYGPGYAGPDYNGFEVVAQSVPTVSNRPPPTGPDWTASLPAGVALNNDAWATTQGIDAVAAARIGAYSQNMVIGRKRTDGSLHATIGHFSASWAPFGWARVPGTVPGGGQLSTQYAPAAVAYGDDVYILAVATSKKMYYQAYSTVSRVWNTAWTEVPGGGLFSSGPAVTEWHGGLHIVAPRTDRVPALMSGAPGWAGGQWRSLGGQCGSQTLTTSTPAAIVDFKGSLLLAARRETDGRIFTRELNSFWADNCWREDSSGWSTGHAPALGTDNFGGLELAVVLIRGNDGRIWSKVATGLNPFVSPYYTSDSWRPVPGVGGAQAAGADAPLAIQHGSNLDVFLTGPNRDALTATMDATNYSNANLGFASPSSSAWKVIPGGGYIPVPVDSAGHPVPAPPPPGTPFTPLQPSPNWYVFCLSGASVPDGYVPILDTSQSAAEAQAREFATGEYGPAGWSVAYVANPAPAGCQEPPPPPPQTYTFCLGSVNYHYPGLPSFLYTVTVTATTYDSAYAKAVSQATAAHGPQYPIPPYPYWQLYEGACPGGA